MNLIRAEAFAQADASAFIEASDDSRPSGGLTADVLLL